MPRPRVLALIQAGGVGGRMDVLTRERAKPALPFAGVHQLVDFPLSNLAHSGISVSCGSSTGMEPGSSSGRSRASCSSIRSWHGSPPHLLKKGEAG